MRAVLKRDDWSCRMYVTCHIIKLGTHIKASVQLRRARLGEGRRWGDSVQR